MITKEQAETVDEFFERVSQHETMNPEKVNKAKSGRTPSLGKS